MKYLSKKRAIQLIREAVAEFPDRRNPTDGMGMCLYTALDDPCVHCLAGEVLIRAGLPPPAEGESLCANKVSFDYRKHVDPGAHGVNLVLRGYMSVNTLIMLGQIQLVFDLRRIAWSRALAYLDRRNLLGP